MTNAIQRFPVTKEDAVLTNKLLDGVFLRNQSEVTAAIISKLNRIQFSNDLDLEVMKKELLAIRKTVAEQLQDVNDLSTAVELSTDDILENKLSIEGLSENVEKNTGKIVKQDKAISEVATKLNDFLYGSDTDGIINKWKELEKFLKGQTELDTLAELLAVKADANDVYSKDVIDDKHTELQRNIQLISNGLSNNQKAVELLTTDVIDNKDNIKGNADAIEECRDDIQELNQNKADKAKTLAGYGIEDAYTKDDVDKSINEINISLDGVDDAFDEINVAIDKVNLSIEDIVDLIGSIEGGSPSWDKIPDKPDFSDVAFSGDYKDIINTPNLVDFVGVQSIGDNKSFVYWTGLKFEAVTLGDNAFSNFTKLSQLENDLQLDTIYVKIGDSVEIAEFANTAEKDDAGNVISETYATNDRVDLIEERVDVLENDTVLWEEILDKPSFASVAFSGDYNDLINKPTTPDSGTGDTSGLDEVLEWFTLDKETETLTTKWNLASDKTVSSLGVGTDDSGDIIVGAQALYELNDVASDGDNVTGAIEGNALVFTDGKWQGGNVNVDLSDIESAINNHESRISTNESDITELKNATKYFTLKLDETGNYYLHTVYSLASDKTVSSLGVGTDDSTGGLGFSILQSWDDESDTAEVMALGSNLGRELYNEILSIKNENLSGITNRVTEIESELVIVNNTLTNHGTDITENATAITLINNRIGPIEEAFNIIKTWFEVTDDGKTLKTTYNLASDKTVSSLGIGTDDGTGGGISYDRLDSWENYVEGSGAVLGADLGYGLLERIEDLEQGTSGDISEISTKVEKHGTAISGLQTQLNTLVNGDASSAIESFNEIVSFLKDIEDDDTLEGILAAKADQSEVDTLASTVNSNYTTLSGLITAEKNRAEGAENALSGRITTNATNIATNASAIVEIQNTLADWFTLEDGVLHSKYGLASDKTVSSLGVGSDGEGGVSYDRLDSWDNYDADAGAVLSATLGYDLKTRLDNLDLGDFDLSGYLTKTEAASTYATITSLNSGLAGKQNTISDLATIRANANLGATAHGWGNHANAGYATEQWVTNRGYATQTALDAYKVTVANTYFLKSSFTQTNIKSTLGISDWALASVKPSYNTSEVTESGNLYFTNARAVAALKSVTDALSARIKVYEDVLQVVNDATNGNYLHALISFASDGTVSSLGVGSDDGTGGVDLSEYLTKTEANSTFLTLSGAQDVQGKKSFEGGVDIAGCALQGLDSVGGEQMWSISKYGSATFSDLTVGGQGVVTIGTQQTVTGMKYFDNIYFNNVPFAHVGSQSVRLATMNDVPSITPLLDSGTEIARIDIGSSSVFLYAPNVGSVDLSGYATKTDLDSYALKSSLGTAASKNWSGAAATDSTNLVTEDWVGNQLSGYVNEIETSGSGNAITSVSKAGKKLTFNKSSSFLTSTPLATASVIGGGKLYSNTRQNVAPNSLTATASRTYAVQVNSSNQLVVNVPWTDTNSTNYYTKTEANSTFAPKTITDNLTNFNGSGLTDGHIDNFKVRVVNAPTSSGGSTYGTGSSGQVLKSNGTSVYWANDTNTTYSVATTSANGLMSSSMVSGLNSSYDITFDLTSTTGLSSGYIKKLKADTIELGDSYVATTYELDYLGNTINNLFARKATTLAGYGITDALPLTGGTMSGSLEIFSTGTQWSEGIRIHPAENLWSGIVLCENSNNGSTGTSTNTWSMHNNEGIFGIYKNGSTTTNTTCYISNESNNWLIGGINVGIGTTTPRYKLDVAGSLNATSICQNGVLLSTLLSGYLPKSGGEIQGNLSVTGSISAQGNITTANGSFVGNLNGTATNATYAGLLRRYEIFPFNATNSTYRKFATITLSAQYSGKVAELKLFTGITSSTSGIGNSCDLYVRCYQQESLGYIPRYSIETNNDDRFFRIYGVLNITSSSSTLDLYADGKSLTYYQLLVVHVAGDNIISIGSSNVSELPSGTVIIPTKMGSVYSASKLKTPRTIWGQSFDGTGNVSGSILTNGDLILNSSSLSAEAGGIIHFGFYGVPLQTDFSTSFKTSMFGNADNGAKFRVARTNVDITNLCNIYGNALAWASSDTNGYLAVDYGGADGGKAYIGGGNADKLNWSARLFHNKMNLVPNTNNYYTLGTSSYQWSAIYGVNGIFSGALSTNGSLTVAGSSTLHATEVQGNLGVTSNITAVGGITLVNGGLTAANGAISCKSLTVNGVSITGNGGGSFTGGTVANATIFGSKGSNYQDIYRVYVNGSAGFEGLIDAWGGIAGDGWEIQDTGDAYFTTVSQGSDYNLKNIIGDFRLSLGTMACAPLVLFDWKNKVNKKHNVGTIAQYWESALPEVVTITQNGTLALSYGELGVAMGISLATHLTNTDDEVAKLKKRVEQLENENKMLQERVDALVA